jgi:hypothetical protein
MKIINRKGRKENLPSALFAFFVVNILFLAGCARFRSTQTETAPDGTQRITRVCVTTFFDGRSDLAKLRASTTDKTQGLTLAGLDQSSSSTNAVEILRHIAAILGAAK